MKYEKAHGYSTDALMSRVDDYATEGWTLHTFTYDLDAREWIAIMQKDDRGGPILASNLGRNTGDYYGDQREQTR